MKKWSCQTSGEWRWYLTIFKGIWVVKVSRKQCVCCMQKAWMTSNRKKLHKGWFYSGWDGRQMTWEAIGIFSTEKWHWLIRFLCREETERLDTPPSPQNFLSYWLQQLLSSMVLCHWSCLPFQLSTLSKFGIRFLSKLFSYRIWDPEDEKLGIHNIHIYQHINTKELQCG